MSNFSDKQVNSTRFTTETTARCKLIHAKKVKEYFFPLYSKFQFLYRDSWEAWDLNQAQTFATNSPI